MNLLYLICIIIIVSMKRTALYGSSLRQDEPLMTSYKYDQDLQEYFNSREFEKINTTDGLYDFIENLQNDQLWIKSGKRSPNWPVGVTRMVQYRVKVDAQCDRLYNDTRYPDLNIKQKLDDLNKMP